ncbi:hypothetical protein ACSSV1_006033 [Labrenzia sp. MBR-25]
MASLPYITSTGNIEKALNAIKTAAVPERISQDFVKTILKIPGGSGAQMTTFLKKINFANSDGKPTDLYTQFRNPSTSGQALAKAIRYAYAPLYVRNEFMHLLSDDELLGLIVEETGQPHDSNPVKLAFTSLKALKKHANFDDEIDNQSASIVYDDKPQPQTQPTKTTDVAPRSTSVGLNLGYTINLNLPATSDQAVFNAIFKSIKEHLLSDDDA